MRRALPLLSLLLCPLGVLAQPQVIDLNVRAEHILPRGAATSLNDAGQVGAWYITYHNSAAGEMRSAILSPRGGAYYEPVASAPQRNGRLFGVHVDLKPDCAAEYFDCAWGACLSCEEEGGWGCWSRRSDRVRIRDLNNAGVAVGAVADVPGQEAYPTWEGWPDSSLCHDFFRPYYAWFDYTCQSVTGDPVNHECTRPFAWQSGVTSLWPAMGNAPTAFDFSAAAVNELGDMVGVAGFGDLFSRRAALVRGELTADLGTFGGPSSYALDINDSGVVVGWAEVDADVFRAFRWQGALTDLGALPGDPSSRARAINNDGDIAGASVDASERQRAVLWSGGAIVDLHALLPGAAWSHAPDLNEHGEVIIASSLGGFLYMPAARNGLAAGVHALDDLMPTGTGRAGEPLKINSLGMMLMKANLCSGIDAQLDWCGGYFLLSQGPVTLPEPEDPYPPPAAELENAEVGGDPVHLVTGDFLLREPADLALAGPLPLVFERWHDPGFARAELEGSLGRAWRHSYEISLSHAGDFVSVVTGSGRTLAFELDDESGAWQPLGKGAQLAATAEGWVLLDERDGRLLRFDAAGRLVGLEGLEGGALAVSWSDGQLSAISDGHGRGLSFTYEEETALLTGVSDGVRTVSLAYSAGRLAEVIGADGAAIRYEYANGSDDRLLQRRGPDGVAPLRQHYGPSGRVVGQLDVLGGTWGYSYGAGGTVVTDPLGAQSTFVHVGGALTRFEDERGGVRTVSYDERGRRVQVSDPLERLVSLSWVDDSARPALLTGPSGETVRFEWQSRPVGELSLPVLVGVEAPGGEAASWELDADGRLSALVGFAGERVELSRDADGRVQSVENPLGGVTSLSWSEGGELVAETDPFGNATSYERDAFGRLVRVTLPDGAVRELLWDEGDRLLERREPDGQTTRWEYDEAGRVRAIVDALGGRTSLQRDLLGRVTHLTDPAERTLEVQWDGAGRVSALRAPLGGVTTFLRDAAGDVSAVTLPDGSTTATERDAAGAVSALVGADGERLELLRDEVGRLSGLVTALGHETRLERDGARVSAIVDAEGGRTGFRYDEADRLLGVDVAGAAVLGLERNAAGQVTALSDGAGERWTRSYDEGGRVSSRGDPLGREVSYERDGRGRVSRVRYPEGLGTQERSYDGAGRLLQASYSDGTELHLSHDAAGRLTGGTGLELALDGAGEVLESNGLAMARDANGRLESVTLAPGKTVRYRYDAVGRVVEVIDWTAARTALSYDVEGRLLEVERPNGLRTRYGYDRDGRLVSLEEVAGTSAISSIQLERDGVGRVKGASREVPLSPAPAAADDAFSFDSAAQVQGYAYDALGRVVADDRRSYTWDLASRLAALEEEGRRVELEYDVHGRVTARRAQGQERRYVWNLAFHAPAVSVQRDDEGDERYWVHLPSGEPLYSVESGRAGHVARRYLHFDERGNTSFLTDEAGEITDAYAYTPFGLPAGRTGSTENPYTFSGRYGVYEESSDGLYRMGGRLYDARSARFLSRDARALGLDWRLANPYQYAGNDPLRFVDPAGEAPKDTQSGAPSEGSPLSMGDVFKQGLAVADQGCQNISEVATHFADSISSQNRLEQIWGRHTTGSGLADGWHSVAERSKHALDGPKAVVKNVGRVTNVASISLHVAGGDYKEASKEGLKWMISELESKAPFELRGREVKLAPGLDLLEEAPKYKQDVEQARGEYGALTNANLQTLMMQLAAIERHIRNGKYESLEDAERQLRDVVRAYEEQQGGNTKAFLNEVGRRSLEFVMKGLMSLL